MYGGTKAPKLTRNGWIHAVRGRAADGASATLAVGSRTVMKVPTPRR
jgi:hypothetical protein